MMEATAKRNFLDNSFSGRDLPLLRKALEIPGCQGSARDAVARLAQATAESDAEGHSLSNKVAGSILAGLCSFCKAMSRPSSKLMRGVFCLVHG
jgi:hypothetical protein